MEYNLDVNGETKVLEVNTRPDGGADVQMGDETCNLNFRRINDHKISLAVNGRQVNAWVEKVNGGRNIILNGQRYFILDNNARDQAAGARKKGSAGETPDVVTPPMPAIVIQVPVAQGDAVEKGDAVVVVSAMKMETSLKAPYAGKITRIGVGEGDKVMPGDILVDIEKQEEAA